MVQLPLTIRAYHELEMSTGKTDLDDRSVLSEPQAILQRGTLPSAGGTQPYPLGVVGICPAGIPADARWRDLVCRQVRDYLASDLAGFARSACHPVRLCPAQNRPQPCYCVNPNYYLGQYLPLFPP